MKYLLPLCFYVFLFFNGIGQHRLALSITPNVGIEYYNDDILLSGKTSFAGFEFRVQHDLFGLSYGYTGRLHNLGLDARHTQGRRLANFVLNEPAHPNLKNEGSYFKDHSLNAVVRDPLRKSAYLSIGLTRLSHRQYTIYSEVATATASLVTVFPRKIWAWNIENGYHWQHWRFGMRFIDAKDNPLPIDADPLPSFSLQVGRVLPLGEVKFGKASEVSSLDTIQDRPKKFHSIFRIAVGYGHWIPMATSPKAGSAIFDLDVHIGLYRSLFLGFSGNLFNTPSGVDWEVKQANFGRIAAIDTTANRFANLQSAGLFVGYDFPIDYPESVFVGLGMRHFWLEQLEFDPNFKPFRNPYFRAPFLRVGLRSGLYANTLTLYVPTRAERPFLEWRMSLGLDFFRVWE